MIKRFKFCNNIYSAQAFGCWLFIQIGFYGFFFGESCRRGLRIILFKPVSEGIYPKKRFRVELRKFKKQ